MFLIQKLFCATKQQEIARVFNLLQIFLFSDIFSDIVKLNTECLINSQIHYASRRKKLYQFTAIDVLTKQRILGVYPSPSSRNGTEFLKKCLGEFPFTIKTVQTDNGPEFLKEFEKLCQELNLSHYFIYPRQAKQNSYVERSHGSDEYEFYQLGNVWQNRKKMNEEITKWQDTWNNFRPHQALNYKTPCQYFEELKGRNLATKDIIILQT